MASNLKLEFKWWLEKVVRAGNLWQQSTCDGCINVLVAHFWREQASFNKGDGAIRLLQQMKIDAFV